MNTTRTELRRRIERLSSSRRALLAERIEALADSSPSPPPVPEQLVAWVVPAGGGEAPTATALAAFLRERVPEHMVPSAFVIVDELPRLPNGKVDLAALPEPMRPAHETDGLVAPRNARETALAEIWKTVLGVDRVSVHDNFFELGGDSILSIQLVARARRAGLHLTPDLVFENQTLGALASAAGTADTDVPRASIETAPLSPIQAWFFEQPLASPHHWHQAIWLLPGPDFDRDRFEHAIRRVVDHHDALRLCFRRGPTGWTQTLARGAAGTLCDIVVPACSRAGLAAALDRTVHDLCAATDLGRGPMLHAAVVRCEGEPAGRILLALHHLAVDAVSWSILLEDLATAYAGDESAAGLSRTTPFLAWCEALARATRSGRLDEGSAFWMDMPSDLPFLPRQRDRAFVEASAVTATASLGEEATANLVHDVHRAYNTNIEDVLLAALARTVTEWMKQPRVLVGVERHGREPLVDGVDLSRTVGWLTSYFPVVLESAPDQDAGTTLRSTKDQLRAIPHRGAGYGALRYLRDDAIARNLAGRPAPEIIFNYSGRVDDSSHGMGPWRRLGPPFASRAQENGRAHRIEVNAFLAGGSLRALWTGSTEQYDRETLDRLAERFLDELRALITHALGARTSGFTPSDFPDAGLSQESLDRLLEGLGA
ncbi:MAG: condensation domain-containing protein [Longimicrobiales bacterium]